MEPDFIAELDRTFTNVGTDIFWTKKIGKLEIWLSPLSVTGQERVTAALEKAVAGLNIVGESKKVTLSNVIVGVNSSDLREFRNGAPAFPSKGKDGKAVNVTLEKFLYDKMASWSTDYLDDVFSVYADLMESFQKQNLKDIKFENAKDPHIELQELEQKAAALRAQLGLPPMIEKGTEENAEPTPESVAAALEAEEQLNQEREGQPGQTEDFNPFKTIEPSVPSVPPVPEAPQQVAVPAPPQHPIHNPQGHPPPPRQQPPPSAQPQPNFTMPAVLPANLRRPVPGPAQESSPENPHVATPSVPNEVIERPMAKGPAVRPQIDPTQGNRNPRFNPPR